MMDNLKIIKNQVKDNIVLLMVIIIKELLRKENEVDMV
jgi:hypothetical protein